MTKNLLFTLLFISSQISAQNLMKIGNENVTVEEFKKIYLKNNHSKASFSATEVNEYINLFSLYKMKLMEAKSKHLDTLSSIKEEYIKYTDQLVQSMLLDKNYTNTILASAYEHMKNDVKVAHIMVKCNLNASPTDTLIAYNKIKQARDKVNKTNFAALAKEYSEDRESNEKGGVIGYISAFMLTPDFEEPCYSTKIGDISNIVRTNFGYHIIHVLEHRPARGRINVAHIYMKKSANGELEDKKMKEAYQAILTKSMTWEEAVKKYSEDASTIDKGGVLDEYGTGEMISEFEEVCFALKSKGDISKPFKTAFGMHMVKLIEKSGLKSFENSKEYIRQKMEKDPRLTDLRRVAYNNILKKYNVKDNAAGYAMLNNMLSDSVFAKPNWKLESNKTLTNNVLFNFENQNFTINDFVKFANENFTTATSKSKSDILNIMYSTYKERITWDATKVKLKATNPEYQALNDEYMNGLLIFEIMDREIWKKAILDTNGAKKVYEQEKNNYWYKDRYQVEGLKTSNAEILPTILAKLNANKDVKSAMNQFKKTKDSNNIVVFEKTYEKEDNSAFDQAMTATGYFSYIDEDKLSIVARVKKAMPPSVKPYNEIKGRIQNIYQTQIEKIWHESLKKKYPAQIIQSELDKLIVK